MSRDHALGALLGAACGDAAGGPLEFLGHLPTEEEIDTAMTLPGGGVFRLAPGQITDDTEMAICLARGLVLPGTSPFQEYLNWYSSLPFDMGGTVRAALTASSSYSTGPNMESKANGSLMRATPLGVMGAGRPTEEIAFLAVKDSALTHPNESCCHAVACYAIAIATLIESRGDRTAAIRRVMKWASANANPEVWSWLVDAIRGDLPHADQMIGFVKIGFIHAFYYLLEDYDYTEALVSILGYGGDTDTNAAIVGGLIGAAVGAEKIPLPMRETVLGCDTLKGRPRPEWLHPKSLVGMVDTLLVME